MGVNRKHSKFPKAPFFDTRSNSHRIHGTGTFLTYIWRKFMVNVLYVNMPYMDPIYVVIRIGFITELIFRATDPILTSPWPSPSPQKNDGISLQLMVQKSCITEHVWNPANNKIFTISSSLSFARRFGSWRMKSFHLAAPSAPIPPTPSLVSVVAGGQVIFFAGG